MNRKMFFAAARPAGVLKLAFISGVLLVLVGCTTKTGNDGAALETQKAASPKPTVNVQAPEFDPKASIDAVVDEIVLSANAFQQQKTDFVTKLCTAILHVAFGTVDEDDLQDCVDRKSSQVGVIRTNLINNAMRLKEAIDQASERANNAADKIKEEIWSDERVEQREEILAAAQALFAAFVENRDPESRWDALVEKALAGQAKVEEIRAEMEKVKDALGIEVNFDRVGQGPLGEYWGSIVSALQGADVIADIKAEYSSCLKSKAESLGVQKSGGKAGKVTTPSMEKPAGPDGSKVGGGQNVPETPGLYVSIAESVGDTIQALRDFEPAVRSTINEKQCERLYRNYPADDEEKQAAIEACIEAKEGSESNRYQIVTQLSTNLYTARTAAQETIAEVRAEIDGEQVRKAWDAFVAAVEKFRTAAGEARAEARTNAEQAWANLKAAAQNSPRLQAAIARHEARQQAIKDAIKAFLDSAPARTALIDLVTQFYDRLQAGETRAKVRSALEGFMEQEYGKKLVEELRGRASEIRGNIDGETVAAIFEYVQGNMQQRHDTAQAFADTLNECLDQQRRAD